ncbi:MAG: phage shock protein PspA [Gammaproteobacteria bacterium]|nr:phage shock protein PspA [Gammaproteobacteria bacterium]NVK88510.1 phage shock protein PspA [Gammaproteobacteria bacterium]
MGIFSRLSDIINSNLNAMLDKAEDPEKMIKLVISEMEQTLAEVRSASVRTLADKKDLSRQLLQLEKEAAIWQEKAELAVAKGRDDLATAALNEKSRMQQSYESLKTELVQVEQALEKLDTDISRLQSKLNEAIARREAMLLRQSTLSQQKRVRTQIVRPDINSAFEKFADFERRIDQMEAEVEAMALGKNPSLKNQIEELVISEKVEHELAEIKKRQAS